MTDVVFVEVAARDTRYAGYAFTLPGSHPQNFLGVKRDEFIALALATPGKRPLIYLPWRDVVPSYVMSQLGLSEGDIEGIELLLAQLGYERDGLGYWSNAGRRITFTT